MGLDLVGLATAFVGLVAALVTLWAVWLGAHNQKVNQVTIAPPSDAKARSYIERTIWERKAPKRPAMALLGVIPSITLAATGLKPIEEDELAELETKVTSIWPAEARVAGSPILRQAFVPRAQPIRDAAGKGIA